MDMIVDNDETWTGDRLIIHPTSSLEGRKGPAVVNTAYVTSLFYHNKTNERSKGNRSGTYASIGVLRPGYATGYSTRILHR